MPARTPHTIAEPAAAEPVAGVAEAKALFRTGQIDEALRLIDALVREHPDNGGVLLQATKMNCMWLRLSKQPNVAALERVRLALAQLETLLPADDRVTQMQHYYRETVDTLRLRVTA